MTTAVLQGNLASFKLPDVLTFLASAHRSGTLTVTSTVRESYVFFDAGSLVFASSTDPQFRLGNVLLRKRKITRAEADAVDDLMTREGGRFGEIALQRGILSEAQLQDYLKVQVSEILYDAFVWTEGVFAFAEELALPSYAVTIAVDLPNLIMEGARRIEEWEDCVRLLPDKDAVYRVVARPAEEKITLTADEWRILFLINGQRTLEELCQIAEDDAFVVYRVVYGLLANKLVEPVSRAGADDTMRQSTPSFGSDSTIREQGADDTSLLIAEDANLSYADVVRPVVGQLRVANDGTTIPLTESEYLVGRHPDNSISLTDPGVSSYHARIFRGPDGYAIEDMKSRNGVWVNGARAYHVVLQHGDVIRVGVTDLVYEVLYA
jgi:hypothetical protein